MLIDTHSHIYWDSYDSDRDEMLKRAIDSGVKYIICPGTDIETSMKAIELAEKYDFVYAAVGFHPHDAIKAEEKELEKIEELSYHPKVVAIGEIGLDFYYNFSPRDKQIEVFRKQIQIAKRRNLPVIIHNRESHKEIFEILESEIDGKWTGFGKLVDGKLPPPRGVFHTFSGTVKDAWRAINLGFYISISGVITFKNADKLVDVVKEIQPEHLLVETDSPFLAPHPFRGKRNEPMYVKFVAEKIAQIQGFTVEDIERTTTFNAYRLFRIGPKPEPKIAYKIRNSLVQMRSTLSFIVLFFVLFVFKREYVRISTSDIPHFVLLGVIGIAGSNFTYYFTLNEINVATAIIMQYTAPVLVVLYGVLFGSEKITFVKIISAFLSLVGCSLVVRIFDLQFLNLSKIGILSGIASAFCWAFF